MNHVVAITKHKATVTITPVNCLASWASRGINFQQRRLLRRRFQINFISARLIFSLSLFIYLSISSFTFHSLRRFRESLPPRVLCVQHALFVEYVAIIDMTEETIGLWSNSLIVILNIIPSSFFLNRVILNKARLKPRPIRYRFL